MDQAREQQPLCSELDTSQLARRAGARVQSPVTSSHTNPAPTLSSRRFFDNVSLGKPLKATWITYIQQKHLPSQKEGFRNSYKNNLGHQYFLKFCIELFTFKCKNIKKLLKSFQSFSNSWNIFLKMRSRCLDILNKMYCRSCVHILMAFHFSEQSDWFCSWAKR